MRLDVRESQTNYRIERLASRGFSVYSTVDKKRSTFSVKLLNAATRQVFFLTFASLSDMTNWLDDGDARPTRILRKFLKRAQEVERSLRVGEFGRIVDLD